jgi:hypothetical protein
MTSVTILKQESDKSRIIEYHSEMRHGWRIGRQRKSWFGWIVTASLWWYCYPSIDKFIDHFDWKEQR